MVWVLLFDFFSNFDNFRGIHEKGFNKLYAKKILNVMPEEIKNDVGIKEFRLDRKILILKLLGKMLIELSKL